jgi:hypothetical protein
MANPIVQFVDSPSTTATVRYDFNVTSPTLRCFPLHEGIDLGTPSFTGEPEGVGAIYGYRAMRLTQRIIGTRAVALARMSLLAKELLRTPNNWLRFQWDASATPVFFKTFRTEPGAISLENAGNADAWDLSVPLEADPFAYGPLVTLSTIQFEQTISTDLDATWNPMTVALPALKGDAPTPLRITLTPPSLASTGEEFMIGCVSGTSSMLDPGFDIGTGDGLTAGTGTAAGVANAADVGGSCRTITIATGDGGTGSSMARRLSGNLTGTLPQGRYKVHVRYEADTAANIKTYIFRFSTYGTTVSVPVGTSGGGAVTQQGWVDLGEIPFPQGVVDIPADATGLTMPTTRPPALPAHRRRHLMPGLKGAPLVRVNDGRTDRIVTRYCRGLKFTKVAPGGHQRSRSPWCCPATPSTTSARGPGLRLRRPHRPHRHRGLHSRTPHRSTAPTASSTTSGGRRHGARQRRDPRADLHRPDLDGWYKTRTASGRAHREFIRAAGDRHLR